MKTRRSFFKIGALLGLVSLGAKAKTQPKPQNFLIQTKPLDITEEDILSVTRFGAVVGALLLEVIFRKMADCHGGLGSAPLEHIFEREGRVSNRLSFKVSSEENKWIHMDVSKSTSTKEPEGSHQIMFEALLAHSHYAQDDTNLTRSIHYSGSFVMAARVHKASRGWFRDETKMLPSVHCQSPLEIWEIISIFTQVCTELKRRGAQVV